MRGIVIDASEIPSDLLEQLEHVMVIHKLKAALPNTLYLFAAFDETHTEGCVACKILNHMRGEDVDKYILPDDMDQSPEVAITTFADMGSDAPRHIQNLIDFEHPDLQSEALMYCVEMPAGSPERIIADGILAFQRLECHNPEHRLEATEGKVVVAGDPSVTN